VLVRTSRAGRCWRLRSGLGRVVQAGTRERVRSLLGLIQQWREPCMRAVVDACVETC